MREDPIVTEVRNAREEYAARFDYDIAAMIRDLQRQEGEQRRRGRQFVSYPPRPPFHTPTSG